MCDTSFETDNKQYLDKKNKTIKKDTVIEQYDQDGRLVRIMSLKNNSLHGAYLEKSYDKNNKINFIMKKNYDNGILSGYYEITKHNDSNMIYLERGFYNNNLLDGTMENYYYSGKDIIASYVYYYVQGIKNGQFKYFANNVITEGNYINDKLEGILIKTDNNKNTKNIYIYENDIKVGIIEL